MPATSSFVIISDLFSDKGSPPGLQLKDAVLRMLTFRLKSGWQCSEMKTAMTHHRLAGWQCSEKFGAAAPSWPFFTFIYTHFGWLCSEMEAGFAIEILDMLRNLY